MNEKEQLDLVVESFWLIVCSVVSAIIWGSLLGNLVPRNKAYIIAIVILVLLNACHWLWGLFHVDNNVTDVLPSKGPLNCSYSECNRIWIRIIAVLTIAPSIYLSRVMHTIKQSQRMKT